MGQTHAPPNLMTTHDDFDVLPIEGDARLIREMLLEPSAVRVHLQHVDRLTGGQAIVLDVACPRFRAYKSWTSLRTVGEVIYR